MNWSKEQLAEPNYYCHSTRSRVPRAFECYQILSPDDYFPEFYSDELNYGYAKGYVQYFMEEHI